MPKAPQELIDERPWLGQLEDYQDARAPQPPKYTIGLHNQIVQEIEAGNRPEVAAAMCGITRTTFRNWIKRGQDGDPSLWQFAQDVEIAKAKAEGRMLSAVLPKTEAVDPENAKWWLERAIPEGYSKSAAAIVQAQLSDFLRRLEENLDSETFAKVLAIATGQTNPGEMAGIPEKPILGAGGTAAVSVSDDDEPPPEGT